MAEFSNAQKLAAILSYWAKPAIAQVASSKMSSMGWMKSLQDSIVGLGLVGSNYNIAADIQPLLTPAVEAVIEPMIEAQLSKLPDVAIPQMARSIINEVSRNKSLTLLDGLIVLEQADIAELQDLIDRNLPYDSKESYKVVRDE